MDPQKRGWCLPLSEKGKAIIQQIKITAAWRNFLLKDPWDVFWQWGITCFHRTSSHCRTAIGTAISLGLTSPKGTAPYQPTHSSRTSSLPAGPVLSGTPLPGRKISQPLALPVLHHQIKDNTFLEHRRKEGGMQFKEVKQWQCWALWCQKFHKFVVLVLVMVPSVGMACNSTSSCVWDTLRNQTSVSCELLSSSQDDSLRC